MPEFVFMFHDVDLAEVHNVLELAEVQNVLVACQNVQCKMQKCNGASRSECVREGVQLHKCHA